MAESALAFALGMHFGSYVPDAIMVCSFAKCVERRVHNHLWATVAGPLCGNLPLAELYQSSCIWMIVWGAGDALALSMASTRMCSQALISLPPVHQIRWCLASLPWLPRLEGWRLFGDKLTLMQAKLGWPEDLNSYLDNLDDAFEEIENELYVILMRSRQLRQ